MKMKPVDLVMHNYNIVVGKHLQMLIKRKVAQMQRLDFSLDPHVTQ